METVAVTITGMTCGHCVKSVTEELTDIGATAVAVDLVKGGESKAQITSATPLSDAQIVAAIEEAGYQVASITRF